MTTASLRRFLATGAFGDVVLSMSEMDILNALGEPTATGGLTNRWSHPSVLKYGSLELAFARGRERVCTLLHIEPLFSPQSFSFPDTISVEDWELKPTTPRTAVEEYLQSESLEYNFTQNRGGQEIVLVRSLVHIVFDDDALWSFSVSA